MKKNFIRRTLSIILALITLIGAASPAVLGVSAAGEKVSASASISSVAINTSKNFYTVKKETALRSSTSIFYSKLATLPVGTVIETSGTSGDYYKVKLSIENQNKTYYVKKADLKAAPKTTNASLCYTVNNAAIRLAPCAEGTKLMNASKGSVLKIIGKLTNDAKNLWYVIQLENGQTAYVYSSNVKTFSKLTLKVSADKFAVTGIPSQITYSVTPAEVKGISFSSSNTGIATVNSKGVLNGVAGGDTVITANLAGLLKASVSVNVSLGVKAYRQTKNNTCSAASALAALRYLGKCSNKKDTDIYTGTYVYMVRDYLNTYLGANYYKWGTFKSLATYESVIRNSLAQNSPVIARVAFSKGYFNYTSSGHYTTIVGIFTGDDGQVWLKLVDSFAHKFDSNDYTDAETGIVYVPLAELYSYGTYSGKSDIYLIYNP